MTPVVDAYSELKECEQSLTSLERDLVLEVDREMHQMMSEDKDVKEKRVAELKQKLLFSMIPEDQDDSRSVVLEIRAGAGGLEAALFAGELMEMYSSFGESKGWRVDVMSLTNNDIGGVRVKKRFQK